MFDIIVIGGGAAGFYGAIHIAEANPSLGIAILERGKQVLSKVKISGGGRCNVAHAKYNPVELVKNFPRGQKELLGPFHTYATGHTIDFFNKRGISIKTEADGRMFPESNSSQTIIDCFQKEVARLQITLLRNSSVIDIIRTEATVQNHKGGWEIRSIRNTYTTKKVLIATGSNPKIWNVLHRLGHFIQSPVPSLFTFNIKDERISGVQGVSTNARIGIKVKNNPEKKITTLLRSGTSKDVIMEEEGPLLITHWGVSGPAVLKLSAWGARILNEYDYKFRIYINWLPEYHKGSVIHYLKEVKDVESKKTVLRTKVMEIPRRLWTNLAEASGISSDMKWGAISKTQLEDLADQLTNSEFQVDGKSTFKEEFVTAGGVDLKEINFKTFESKLHPNMYFAGEVINVDAITGGFNFQNAWTSAYIAAKAIAEDS